MSTATIAPTTKGTPAAIAAATLPTLAEALAAYDNDASHSAVTSATLAAVVLARFTRHASDYVATVEGGTRVLLANHKRDVQQHVWAEATGKLEAPSAKDRTPGETSIGQYLAKFGTVAVDMAHGLDALSTPATANIAYKAISDKRKGVNEEAAARRSRAAHAAYVEWRKSLPQADRAAVERVVGLFGGNSTAAIHAPAFVDAVTLAVANSDAK